MSSGPCESPKHFNPVTAYLEISFIFMLPEAMSGHVCIELNALFIFLPSLFKQEVWYAK